MMGDVHSTSITPGEEPMQLGLYRDGSKLSDQISILQAIQDEPNVDSGLNELGIKLCL